MSTAAVVRPQRTAIYDGLRGIAIVLVILSHGWTLWPTDGIDSNPVTKTLFESGNFAVSIFFVVGFFLATRSLLRRVENGQGVSPPVLVARRYVRIGGQLAFAMVVLTVITAMDDSDPYGKTETRNSIIRIMTFTWNQYLQTRAIVARPDLGHLWYLSVDFQIFILVVVLVWLLRRHRAWLVVTLAGILVACFMWRAHIYGTEGIYQALLRTTVRMDAPVIGALAAAAMPYLGFLRRQADWIAVASCVALVPLAHLASPDHAYFGLPGVGVSVALALFMVSTSLAQPPAVLVKALSWRLIALLGERSLSLYIWHYPLFWYVSRHSEGWSTFERTVGGILLTLLASVVSEYLVERRVQKVLAHPGWRDFDDGIFAWAARRTRGQGKKGGGRRAAAPATSARTNPPTNAPTGPVADDDTSGTGRGSHRA
ncbi:acyltransferase family protein [Nocardioides solisilvae]|uniref:acyltransferase family protein n=1 Tax=Nocardioides solisilvae TaxID=1542435 RepID=UPI000D74972B|nr:acyltransferase [Nocardioides solisilvae]